MSTETVKKHECKCTKQVVEKHQSMSERLSEADSFSLSISIVDKEGKVSMKSQLGDMTESRDFVFYGSQKCLYGILDAILKSRDELNIRNKELVEKLEVAKLESMKKDIDEKLKDLNGGK